MTRLRIVREPCDGCPFKGRLQLGRGRLREILDSTTVKADERYFVCHRTIYSSGGRVRKADAVFGVAAVCPGWIEAVEKAGRTLPAIVQVAGRLNLVELIEPPPTDQPRGDTE